MLIREFCWVKHFGDLRGKYFFFRVLRAEVGRETLTCCADVFPENCDLSRLLPSRYLMNDRARLILLYLL